MAKKKLTLVQKVSILLNFSIFLAKLKKPIIPMLVSLKKLRNFKKSRLFKPYNRYTYVKDYEFSPSNTPLFQFYTKPKRVRISFRKVYSNFVVVSKCLGLGLETFPYRGEMGVETFPCGTDLTEYSCGTDLTEYSCGEEESVDERAERFIQRFYEEMRMQRQESHLQLNSTLEV